MVKMGKNEPECSDKDAADDACGQEDMPADKLKKHASETHSHKKHFSEDQTSQVAEDKADKANAEISELKDRYLRLLAEYENYRKRSQKEREALYLDAIAEVAKEWLPVIDNIERTQCFSKEISDTTAEKISEGIDLISRQVADVMGKLGIKEIDCEEGGCFDPELHEAVLHINDETLGEQCVSQVFLKGYRAGDRIIRHSVVKVAN